MKTISTYAVLNIYSAEVNAFTPEKAACSKNSRRPVFGIQSIAAG
jgi:hypothetical protein